MTKRKRIDLDPDRFDALYDELFADVAELPIETVQQALADAGVDRAALHRSFQSRMGHLAAESQSRGHASGPSVGRNTNPDDVLAPTTAAAGEPHVATVRSSSRAQKHWTNASVLRFAGNEDPVDAVIREARALVTRALDHDWHGPPYDPLQLAHILGLEVKAVADIPDARTIPKDVDRFCIEFNPNRPMGRVRYSLAHEIAHTLFPDCGDMVRNRVAHTNATRDEWQLEALCNIAAAELLMPFGSFPTASTDLIDINRIVALQKEFKVSTEALLLRVIHLSRSECAAFGASQVGEGRQEGRWRIDYVVGSPVWKIQNLRGFLTPAESSLRDCSKVGFTTSVEEDWAGMTLQVEAVALPPYPGTITPRVAGFLKVPGASTGNRNRLTEVRGNALEPRTDGPKLVVHVVTDKAQTWGGRGFAAAVRQKWPHVHADFAEWAGPFGRNLKLGQVRFCRATEDIRVASLVAQHGYGGSRTSRIRYTALAECIRQAFATAVESHETVHLPRIGTGHGGGSWEIIRDILEDTAAATGVKATVYLLPSQAVVPDQKGLNFSVDPQPGGQSNRG